MSSFEEFTLLDLCKVSTGKKDANHGQDNGKFPFFTCASVPIRANTYSFDGDSIILPGNGANVGLVLFYSGKFEAYQRTYVLNQFKDFVDVRYIYQLLKRDWDNINRNAQYGSATNYIRMQNFENFKVKLPPLEEQKRIAAILDKADAVRHKRQKAIELSEQLLRSVFLDMFGDPVTNPKGLPTASLIEVSKKVTDGTHQSPVWSETGIPFLFISNIVNNEISFQVDKYITEKNWLELTKNSPIEEGDVLYTTVGSYGNAALVKENTRFCFQRHIAHIKPIKNIIHPTFLWVMMNSPGIKKQADKQVRGIAQKTLNLGELKQFIIFVPTMSKQIEFVNIVTQHKAILNKLIAESSLANNLFNSLTQQVFSGELNNQTKVEST
ncbi:TPA: restriction endonuclease subunit S [Legionella pneumophila subsp. pneumophila]|nr:restriction endonuclease subunit S [Legionella pneumophila subsp. pneumophila]HAT9165955.1 restriction endonuclease subunit S [Legionella pneumophila subsp. pneumophila]HDI5486237.1 restriction endonuclease subunit S [Legionella pneumophila]